MPDQNPFLSIAGTLIGSLGLSPYHPEIMWNFIPTKLVGTGLISFQKWIHQFSHRGYLPNY